MSRASEKVRLRLQELQIEAKKSLGQNFLVSDHVIQKIIAAATDIPSQKLIEIGPGLGALTDDLLALNRPTTLIEFDSTIAAYWKSRLSNNQQLVEADALRLDWSQLIESETLLVSNLPYQISSSLVIDRSVDDIPLKAMVLMFQKEVAQKIMAKGSDFGLLSAVAQSFWKIETLLEAGPSDFNPPPKIASRVLVFKRFDRQINAPREYLKFLKACFLHPRKFMIAGLQERLPFKKDQILTAYEKLGMDPKIRSGQLSVDALIKLHHLLQEEAGKGIV